MIKSISSILYIQLAMSCKCSNEIGDDRIAWLCCSKSSGTVSRSYPTICERHVSSAGEVKTEPSVISMILFCEYVNLQQKTKHFGVLSVKQTSKC